MNAASSTTTITSVHPHGRGDNNANDAANVQPIGSPPRAWGQYRRQRSVAEKARFTPTGVGTMLINTPIPLSTSVHPHGRGDNAALVRRQTVGYGSPPRAWGQFSLRRAVIVLPRFTPTGVGTISDGSLTRPNVAVHPHGRGDNPWYDPLASAANGSPPRAWGQFAHLGCRRAAQRFTPTGVGTMDRLLTP